MLVLQTYYRQTVVLGGSTLESETQVLSSIYIDFHHIRDGETTIKIKFSLFEGGGHGVERKIAQNTVFRGKRHDNEILKVQILLSRNFVVIAQAPITIATERPAYHSFQNHCTHESIILKLFWGLQLQLSGVFRIN